MMWISMAFLFVAMIFCPMLRAEDRAPSSIPQDGTAVASDNSFGVDLYSNLINTNKGNTFFSPYSIRTALAMTYAGARANTSTEMASVLHLDNVPPQQLHAAFASLIQSLNAGDKSYQLTVANALWGQSGYGFQKDFQDLLASSYCAALHEMDFKNSADSARLQINKWVEDQTFGKIKDLLASGALNASTRLVLTNAIYFKAAWFEPFRKEQTRDEPFHLDPTHDVQTSMMHHKVSTLRYLATDQFQAVGLPYKDGQLSMVLIVPKAIDGLPMVQKALSADSMKQWLNAMQTQPILLTIPKFTIVCEFGLADTLKSMGMKDAFDRRRADFSGMVTPSQAKTEPLFLSAVVHKAFVSVDEEGTEAAAATAVHMAMGAAMRQFVPPIVVTADHPFLFLIRHRDSGAILFMGQLIDPHR